MKTNFAFLVYALISIQSLTAADFFVSFDGDDNNAGTIDKPLRTVEAALSHINRNEGDGSSTIYLRDGIYHLDKPIVINPDNTQLITITAWENEEVIISGGQELQLNWTLHKDGVYQAQIHDESLEFDELYISGERYHMARYPNYDAGAKYFGGTSPDAISPSRIATWSNPTGGYMHSLHEGLWGSKHYEIVGMNPDGTATFRGGWQENRGGGFDPIYRGGYHKRFLFVENIMEELDAPGEWYFDQDTKTLFVYPYQTDELENAKIIGARLHELFHLVGTEENPVENIHIQNLRFQYTSRVFMQPYERLLRGDWSIARLSAVRLTGTENCSITDSVFQDLGGNAVFIDGYNRNTIVEGNHFTKLGESAICIVGDVDAVRSPAISYANTLPQDQIDLTPGPKTNDYPADCLIQNNLIHDIGYIGKQTAGVFISMAEEITVSHNTIFNCPRAAICINDGCWGGHIIEKNYAFNTVRESGDHGPFNSWGRDRFWKTSYNGGRDIEPFAKERAMLDNYKTTHIRLNRFEHDGGHSWGIDLDDGSSNYRVYKNLCIGMGVKLREGFYRRVENNIIINGFGGFHIWFPDCEDVIQHNIFVSDKPYQFIRANPSHAKTIDHNLFYHDGSMPVITGVGEPMSLTEWQAKGFDQNSILANPKFTAPDQGDYQLQIDSPAFDVGFERFPLDEFGVTKPQFIALVNQARTNINLSSHHDEIENVRHHDSMEWLGATVKNLVGKDEMSAAGMTKETGIMVVSVPNHSQAKQIGIQEGDVLIGWNDQAIDTVSDLKQLIQDNKKYPVRLSVMNSVERTVLFSK